MLRRNVAIVGYGPTGQVLAGLLGTLGISTAVFERDEYVFQKARTGGIDAEALRTFQRLGVVDAILAQTRPASSSDFVSTAGELLLTWARDPTDVWPHGYTQVHMWHQPDIDALVREHVGRMASVDVHLSNEVLEIEQSDDAVTLSVFDNRSDVTDVCEAGYVVGCDGGRSLTRRAMGSKLLTLGEDEPWVVVDVELTRDVPLPERTRHYCDPARPVTFIRTVGRRRRWEFMLIPGEDPAEMVQPASIWRLRRPWLQPGDAEIYRAVVYTFHSLIVDKWRHHRLLLAGDSAHQMPPFLGQGLCSGIRDARNLAWKLAMVIAGTAPASLLDSYGSERSPHTREYIELATQLGDIIQTTDPQRAKERDD